MLFLGLTAHFLLRQVYPVKSGDIVLVHAAAGKVGLLLCQWAKHLGATVIGTVGNDAKAELAAQIGCDLPLVYTRENIAEAVARITRGAKADVVYNSVGKDTFAQSLDSLRPRGMLVSFGVALRGDATARPAAAPGQRLLVRHAAKLWSIHWLSPKRIAPPRANCLR